MANPTPPESPRPVERDEWIAIFVTLATLGGVGLWVFTGGNLRRITPNQIAGVDIPGLARDGDRPGGSSDTDEDSATARYRGRLQPLLSPERGESERSRVDSRSQQADEPRQADGEETARLPREERTEDENGRRLLGLGLAGESVSREVDGVGSGLGDEARTTLGNGDLDQETGTEMETPVGETPMDEPGSSETEDATPEEELAGIPTPTDDVNDDSAIEVRPDISEDVGDPIDFADVEEGNWAKPYIDAMSARGLIEGVEPDRFAPEEPVTRAQYARLVQQIFESDNGLRDSLEFNDIDDDYWAASDIDTAVRLGFLSGYPGAEFRPEQSISRLEVLLSLRAGLNLDDPDDPDQILQAYGDRQTVPNWAKSPVSAAVEAELDRKPPGSQDLDLERPATRAEVTAMFYQALVRAGYAEPLP